MIVGQGIYYTDSSKVKHQALVKTINTRDENEPGHRLAAGTQPSISLVYVDLTGTVQTINGVKSQGQVAPAGANFYTEA